MRLVLGAGGIIQGPRASIRGWLRWERQQPFTGTDHSTSHRRPGHWLSQACGETNVQRMVLPAGETLLLPARRAEACGPEYEPRARSRENGAASGCCISPAPRWLAWSPLAPSPQLERR